MDIHQFGISNDELDRLCYSLFLKFCYHLHPISQFPGVTLTPVTTFERTSAKNYYPGDFLRIFYTR